MIARNRSGSDIVGSATLQIGVLIIFVLLVAALVMGPDGFAADGRQPATDAEGERITADVAAEARLIAKAYFGPDLVVGQDAGGSVEGDLSYISATLGLFKSETLTPDAQAVLAERKLPDLWSELADQGRGVAEARKSLAAVETALEKVGGVDDVAVAVSELVAYNRELQIRNLQLIGQLANLERRAGNTGKPPCWVTPDGRAEYTYKITITDLDFLVEPLWRAEREDDVADIGASVNREAVRYDDEGFSRAMYPFLAYGVESDPECRFFVQVVDDTGPFKGAWQERLALVEGYFYKFWVK